MKPATQAAVEKAHELQRQVEELQSQISALLTDPCQDVMDNGELSDIRELIAALPDGVNRTELRNFYNRL